MYFKRFASIICNLKVANICLQPPLTHQFETIKSTIDVGKSSNTIQISPSRPFDCLQLVQILFYSETIWLI